MKRLLPYLFLFLPVALWAGNKNDLLQLTAQHLGLPIIADSVLPPGVYNITYQPPADSAYVLAYLHLLQTEYGKYPAGYLPKLGLKQLVLARNLQLNGQPRTAIPDATTQTLYLEIDGDYGLQNPGYLIHVMHHELHHYAEYALWNDMYYRWRKWLHTNPLRFKYRGAGVLAYADPSINWYAFTHPQKGFMNYYSTTAAEEDRCELVGLLMSDEGADSLKRYFRPDARLRRKVKLVATLLNKISGTNENYWTRQVKWLKRKPF